MTLVTGADSIRGTEGSISQILIGEQPDYSTQVTDASRAAVIAENGVRTGGEFYNYQPRLNSADIASEGDTIPSEFLEGSAAQSKDAPGPLDIANGLSLGLSGNGTALPLAMLTQDRDPDWHIYGGSGKTLPAEVTIANDQELNNVSGAATVADNLSGTTNPVNVTVTVSSQATISGTRAFVIVNGTDNSDDAISETIAFRPTLGNRAATGRLWFKTITGITSAGWDEDSTKTFDVTARDLSAEVTFVPQDDEWVRFWTAEVAKGNVANVYDGLAMQSATIEIGREVLSSFDCTFLGRRSYLYQNLAGQTGVNALKTDASGLGSASADVFVGWQAKMTAENADIHVAAQDVTLTFNQNLAYTNVLGFQYQVSPPVRSEKRLVQIEATVVYDRRNDYSTYFTGNSIIPNVRFDFQQMGLGAYPYLTTLEIPELQLTSSPDPAVADQGVVTQNIIGKAVLPVNRTSEYFWTCRYSAYSKVRNFTAGITQN